MLAAHFGPRAAAAPDPLRAVITHTKLPAFQQKGHLQRTRAPMLPAKKLGDQKPRDEIVARWVRKEGARPVWLVAEKGLGTAHDIVNRGPARAYRSPYGLH